LEDVDISGGKNKSEVIQFPPNPARGENPPPGKHQPLKSLPPLKFALLQNYPNPFNPETWIPYQLAAESKVMIKIYDASGMLVRNLFVGRRKEGYYTKKAKAGYWNGRSNTGEQVVSGVYFYTIHAGTFTATRRMMVIR